jgi:carbon storage regulator
MLVLSRKLNESIIIAGDIRITIVGIRGNHVRVGIEAPDSIPIMREELCHRMEGTVRLERPMREEIGRGQASVPLT